MLLFLVLFSVFLFVFLTILFSGFSIFSVIFLFFFADAVVVTTGRHAYRDEDDVAVVPAALLGP